MYLQTFWEVLKYHGITVIVAVMKNIEVTNLFASGHTLIWSWLVKCKKPWEILPKLSNIILEIGKTLDSSKYYSPKENIWIAKSATVASTASINGPAIIGENSEIRHCAFIRGSALVGDNCVVGNSVELKNCVLFDEVQVPHFNYVGDSILGHLSHMGAGAVTSNVKSDHSNVVVHDCSTSYETGLFKFGAILGDNVEVGCNSVLNPGTVVGKNSNVYPTSSVRGVVPENSIFKSGKTFEIVPKNQEGTSN